MKILLSSACICILLACSETCCAESDNQTYLVWYQREEGYGLDEFRLILKRLNHKLNVENVDVLPCVGSASICLTTGQCVSELLQHDKTKRTNCSILVYNYQLQPLHTTLARQSAKQTSLDLKIAQHEDGNRLDVNAELQNQTSTEKPTPGQVWGFGVLAVSIISLSGLFGAVFWPLMKTDIYAQMMWVLIGLAVGSLTASATFQLIPEGFKLKEHGDDYLTTAVFMWTSFWALYMFEALAKIFFHDEEKQTKAITSASTGSLAIPQPRQKIVITSVSIEERSHEDLEQDGLLPSVTVKSETLSPTTDIPLYMSQGSLHNLTSKKSSHLHSHGRKKEGGGKTTAIAWMIIFGDGIHNFIDGMSIGAGFSQSIAVGTSISIAIACEEFPHELGDFAILINSGMSVKRALLYNFLSACTSFAGLILGILLGEIDASVYIFAFAGGLFLYIALTDLMPELNEMIATGLIEGKKRALFVLLLQNAGIFTGATILYLVTRLPINIG